MFDDDVKVTHPRNRYIQTFLVSQETDLANRVAMRCAEYYDIIYRSLHDNNRTYPDSYVLILSGVMVMIFDNIINLILYERKFGLVRKTDTGMADGYFSIAEMMHQL